LLSFAEQLLFFAEQELHSPRPARCVVIIASVIPYYSLTEHLLSCAYHLLFFAEHLLFFAEQELHSTLPARSVDHCFSVISYYSTTEHLLSFAEHLLFLLNRSCTLRGKLEVLIIVSVISYNSLTEHLLSFAEHLLFFAEQELHSKRPDRSCDHY
jgi:hypothetical protein